jgi:hypothetical protein
MRNIFFGVLAMAFTGAMHAQLLSSPGQIHGNVGIDAQYYTNDSLIGAPEVPEKFRMNAFLNLVYTNNNFRAGARYEAYLPGPLLGFDPRFEGQGIPFRYAGYTLGDLDITAGHFYEQFGNGLILRAYEERALGFDNPLDGFRAKYTLFGGIRLTALVGRQRYFWEMSDGVVKAFDAEASLNQLFPKKDFGKFRLLLGGSFVSRYQGDQEIPNPDDPNKILDIPLNVGSFAGRANLGYGKFQLNGEFAWKINDPNFTNQFIYRPGNATYLSASYATKGLGITLQGKRVENFDYRSDRNESGNALLLNFIPMLNKQHTYTLPATIYPYAVQANGELGWQADVNFTTPKWFRGKYSTLFNLNFSMVNGLDTTRTGDRQGYTSELFAPGRLYYLDGNIEINQKISKKLKLNLMYMYLWVDRNQTQGLGTSPREIASHIAVADLTWKVAKRHTLRMELQTLQTAQELDHIGDRVNGSWLMGMIEYSLSPNFFVSVMDQWAYDNPVADFQIHYITTTVGYNSGATRIALSYGRQREGIVCIGGVCRQVPASNGLTLSLMSSF